MLNMDSDWYNDRELTTTGFVLATEQMANYTEM